MIIAIDGHSSCGKSTVAKQLARILNYTYIDSGAMYRAVTLFCLRNNLIKNHIVDVENLKKRLDEINIHFRYNDKLQRNETILNNEVVEDEIRLMEVSNNVSPVSTIAFVREKMVMLQRELSKEGNIVMDGRDIGTVVFPDADLKVFMTASPEIRANRRYLELTEKGDEVSFDEILANVVSRDKIDSTREASPLRKADDALELDNSNLTREEQLEWIISKVHEIKN